MSDSVEPAEVAREPDATECTRTYRVPLAMLTTELNIRLRQGDAASYQLDEDKLTITVKGTQ